MVGRIVAMGACAALLGGCGGSSSSSSSSKSSSSPSSSKPGLTLSINGGTGNLNGVECGKQEAFEHFDFPAQVSYSGSVSPAPSGRWKVKLKLKRCNGSSFADTNSQKIVGQPNGQFDGVFVIPARGAYSLRATLEGAGKPQSPKVYLRVG
jgi:hypothetical protein